MVKNNPQNPNYNIWCLSEGVGAAWGGWPCRQRRPARAVSFDTLVPCEAQARTTVIAGTRQASLFLYALQVLETSENSFDPVAARVTENVCAESVSSQATMKKWLFSSSSFVATVIFYGSTLKIITVF